MSLNESRVHLNRDELCSSCEEKLNEKIQKALKVNCEMCGKNCYLSRRAECESCGRYFCRECISDTNSGYVSTRVGGTSSSTQIKYEFECKKNKDQALLDAEFGTTDRKCLAIVTYEEKHDGWS